jgi:hypothetical protein
VTDEWVIGNLVQGRSHAIKKLVGLKAFWRPISHELSVRTAPLVVAALVMEMVIECIGDNFLVGDNFLDWRQFPRDNFLATKTGTNVAQPQIE